MSNENSEGFFPALALFFSLIANTALVVYALNSVKISTVKNGDKMLFDNIIYTCRKAKE